MQEKPKMVRTAEAEKMRALYLTNDLKPSRKQERKKNRQNKTTKIPVAVGLMARAFTTLTIFSLLLFVNRFLSCLLVVFIFEINVHSDRSFFQPCFLFAVCASYFGLVKFSFLIFIFLCFNFAAR